MAMSEQLEEQIVVGMFDRGLLGFPEGGIKLKSGRNSPYYYNDRKSLSFRHSLDRSGQMSLAQQAEFRRALGQGFGQRFLELSVKLDHIFGKAQSGTGPVAIGAYEADLSYLWERVDEPNKSYGMHEKIEGDYEPGQKVGIGDDVVTTGKAKFEGEETLRAAGLDPVSVTIKFDRQEGGMEALAAHGFETNALTDLTKATGFLLANSRIGNKELDLLFQYHEGLRAEGLTTTFGFHP